MTGSDSSNPDSRPISVAELLAKNGTIGSPPVSGRRRRRRGNNDAVSVAELTGEIPIIAVDAAPPTPLVRDAAVQPDDLTASATSNGAADEQPVEPGDEAEMDTEAEVGAEGEPETKTEPETRTEPEPVTAPPRRPLWRRPTTAAGAAEEMSPDTVDDAGDALDDAGDALDGAIDIEEPEVDYADDTVADADELPSYLRSSQDALFGGDTVADDLARRGGESGTEELEDELKDGDLQDELKDRTDEADAQPESRLSTLLRGASVVGQCVIAVAFGAGLFVAFDQLWKWNPIVALVLSVLVILGLVVGVRVVRKTEDIGSTLIAVAVGAMVTLGPLALLQSG